MMSSSSSWVVNLCKQHRRSAALLVSWSPFDQRHRASSPSWYDFTRAEFADLIARCSEKCGECDATLCIRDVHSTRAELHVPRSDYDAMCRAQFGSATRLVKTAGGGGGGGGGDNAEPPADMGARMRTWQLKNRDVVRFVWDAHALQLGVRPLTTDGGVAAHDLLVDYLVPFAQWMSEDGIRVLPPVCVAIRGAYILSPGLSQHGVRACMDFGDHPNMFWSLNNFH